MGKLYGKWISKDTDNLTHLGENLAVKFSDGDAPDANKVWSSEKINTISGTLNTAIGTAISDLIDTAPETLNTLNELAAALGDDPNLSTTVIGMINTISGALTTHKTSDDHDGRYYTQSEVDSLTWSESDITDLDKYTQAEVDVLLTTISGDITAQIPTDFYTQEEVNTISGALNDKIIAVGGTDEIEYLTLDAGHISNKYINLAHTPITAEDVLLDIIGGGSQFYGTDYTVVSGTQLGWAGLSLDGLLEVDDKFRVSYTYTA